MDNSSANVPDGAPQQDRVKLRPPPNNVKVQFPLSWIIVSPFVYRYEDQLWIDEFFDTGKLRLSTFAKFATYPDEVRGDEREGHAACYGETQDGHSVGVMQAQGNNAAVLCCSHWLSSELRDSFGRNSAFEIANTTGFAVEVARQLAGYRHGLEGSCIYRSEATINRQIDFDFDRYKQADGTVDRQMIFDAGQALGGSELVLLKRKRYSFQQEYRLLWELDGIADDHIDIVAPQARQYCRKLDAEDWA